MANKFNYYKNELSKVNLKSEYAPNIKINSGEGDSTKWFNLNQESAEILVAWLKNNFLTKK
jgi:hypothetical protein